MEKVSIKRSPDCCGCPSFPLALCPPCQRYNLRNNHSDWPFETDLKPPNIYKSIEEAIEAGLTTIPATTKKPIPKGIKMDDKQYYRIREIADIMNISEQTIFRMIKEGTLKAKRFAGSVRIAKEDFINSIKDYDKEL